MIYEVVEYFEDLQDDMYPYKKGDTYPRKGLEVSEARIKQLSTTNNARNTVFIVEKAEKKSEPAAEKPKKVTKNGQSSSTKSVKSRLGKKE